MSSTAETSASHERVHTYDIDLNRWRWRVLEFLKDSPFAEDVAYFFDYSYYAAYDNREIDQNRASALEATTDDGRRHQLLEMGAKNGKDYFASSISYFRPVVHETSWVRVNDASALRGDILDLTVMQSLGHTLLYGGSDERDADLNSFKHAFMRTLRATESGALYEIHTLGALTQRSDTRPTIRLTRPLSLGHLIDLAAQTDDAENLRLLAGMYVETLRRLPLGQIVTHYQDIQRIQAIDFDLSSRAE